MSTEFAHLHVASGFSMRYGTATPEALVERAAQHRQPILALTDRDGLYGAVRFVQAATAAGIWANAADQPADCSFILPAIARNGPLAVAVSTGGASPALARRLRDHAGALLSDEVIALAAELQARRAAVREAGGSTEDVDWSGLIDPVLPPLT